MNGPSPGDPLVHAFEEQRGQLIGVAYRMLGSRTDAEDAVQEAWLRLARKDADSIDNLGGWLTTVVSRVCIDMLRSRKIRPEAAYDDRLPELVVTEDTDADPEDHAVMADSVGLALMVVLDTLGPAERLAFVLHDMFAVPFREIAEIIGTSEDAAKMHASRARRKVQTTRPPTGDLEQQRSVVDAFLAASRAGDFDRLLNLLDPDVTWRIHTTRGLVIKRGAREVAARQQRAARARGTARRVLVNGSPGFAAWNPEGRLRAVLACTVANGRIVEMESVTDPRRLRHIDLPASQDSRG